MPARTHNRKTAMLGALLLAAVLMSAGPASADRATQSYWERHDQAKRDLVTLFLEDAQLRAYVGPLQNLISAEIGLLASGVRFQDPRLYGALGEGLQGTAVQAFVARMVISGVQRHGYLDLGDPDATFSGETFVIQARGVHEDAPGTRVEF